MRRPTQTADLEDLAMPVNLRDLFLHLQTHDLSAQDSALIFFFLRLLERLQSLGTVPAMNLREYGRALERQNG